LVVASLIAAYMSTVATLLNWGSSYVVQDVYLRFLKPNASPKHAVLVGRLTMLAMLLTSAGIAFHMTTVKAIFHVLLQVGAGTGLLYILRWFWWRMNVWSEVRDGGLVPGGVLLPVRCRPAGAGAAMDGAGWFRVMDFTSWKMILGHRDNRSVGGGDVQDEASGRAHADQVLPHGPPRRTRVRKKIEDAARAAARGGVRPRRVECARRPFVHDAGLPDVWAALFGVGYLLYGRTRSAVSVRVSRWQQPWRWRNSCANYSSVRGHHPNGR
jgi:hypothetical protein